MKFITPQREIVAIIIDDDMLITRSIDEPHVLHYTKLRSDGIVETGIWNTEYGSFKAYINSVGRCGPKLKPIYKGEKISIQF